MQGCPANAEAALVVVVVVVHRADGVGALRPGPEGLVVGTPDAAANGDAQPLDAHRAQAVDVDVAAKVENIDMKNFKKTNILVRPVTSGLPLGRVTELPSANQLQEIPQRRVT